MARIDALLRDDEFRLDFPGSYRGRGGEAGGGEAETREE
jgi:hypothetical protein